MKNKTNIPKKKTRTPVTIDWGYVGELLMAGCSGVGIAAVIGIHENTLYDRCKKDNSLDFVAFAQQKRKQGNDMIHAKQFEKAIKDKDTSMLIWLGKNRLDQKDKHENTGSYEIALKEAIIKAFPDEKELNGKNIQSKS